jgi:hypothetical protein
MRYTKTLTTAVAVALIVGVGSTADAAPVDISGGLTVSAGDYDFRIRNDLCDESAPAFNIDDASTLTNDDAFDGGGVLTVDGTFVGDDDDSVEETTNGGDTTLAMTPQTISGLQVDLSFRIIGTDGVIRELLTLTNPTAAPITAEVTTESNWGADGATSIAGTSSGDATFTTADRWMVATEGATEPAGDAIPGAVFYGPGSPAVTPSSVGTTVFDCAGTQGGMATYSVTVPAAVGEPSVPSSRHLMWFFRLTDPGSPPQVASEPQGDVVAQSVGSPVIFGATIPEAVGRMSIFDTTPAAGSALVAGIDAAQLPNIVNWDYLPAAQPTTTTTAPPAATTTTTTSGPVEVLAGGATPAQPVVAAPRFTG